MTAPGPSEGQTDTLRAEALQKKKEKATRSAPQPGAPVTRTELAARWRVHPKTITRLAKSGMPCLRAGRVLRFEVETAERWLAARKAA